MRTFISFRPGTTDITATSNGNARTRLSAILSTILASNGGPMQTYALVTGSPAIDAVNNGTCPPPATDQRGIGRPQDGNGDGDPACDIGAYELVASTQPPPPPPPLTTAQCQSINATIAGTGAGATLTGTNGVDVIQSFGGNDVLNGIDGNDVTCGGMGNERSLRALTTAGYSARSARILVMVVRAGLRRKAASGATGVP
ncbi:MAG TPA: choice-of-anchor Q domain-containing protein [Gammaproteobacteria bacterium]|nr:choice-of-anchor Q domain-containing protein [Gammaproteobacteria bacterium]